MMSISLAASCLRIANICSCLRMVEAFSTACSSAKASSSVGVLDLRSWSFISRMRGFPRVVRRALRKGANNREGEGGEPQVSARIPPDAESGPADRKLVYIRLRFRRVMAKYEMSEAKARGRRISSPRGQPVALRDTFLNDQNGLTMTRITIPIIRTVGTSLMIR